MTRIAYVTTHYPRVALTFISGEVDAMEERGIVIAPFAMNLPADADLGIDQGRRTDPGRGACERDPGWA